MTPTVMWVPLSISDLKWFSQIGSDAVYSVASDIALCTRYCEIKNFAGELIFGPFLIRKLDAFNRHVDYASASITHETQHTAPLNNAFRAKTRVSLGSQNFKKYKIGHFILKISRKLHLFSVPCWFVDINPTF